MAQVIAKERVNKHIYHYDRLVVLFLIWTVLQDCVLGFLYTIIPVAPFIKFLLYLKDIMMVLLFLYGAIKLENKNNKYFKVMVFYFIWILFEFVYGVLLKNASITDIASSTRGFILLPCFFVIGYSIKNKEYFDKKVDWFLNKFLIFIAIIGIVEFLLDYIIGTKGFWLNTLGFTAYMTDIKGQAARLEFGLPGNFYGSYGGLFFSQKRLVSLWGNPLTSGYVLMMPLIYYFVKIINHKKGFFNFLICAIAVILTYTRAIIFLSAFIMFVLLVFYKKHYRLLLIAIPVAALFVAWKYEAILRYVFDGSTNGHILAIVNSLKQINILGSGFGSFGINSSVGTESTYITCIGQTGILGLILYLVLNFYLLRRLRIIYLLTKDNLALALYCMQVIYLLSGLISEQLTASTTIAPFYIISGFYVAEHSFCKKKAESKIKVSVKNATPIEAQA